MKKDLRLRLRWTRRGLARTLAAVLLCACAGALESQDVARTVTLDMSMAAAPVGAFAQLVVGGNSFLATNGGNIAIGNWGTTGNPAGIPFLVAGRTAFGNVMNVGGANFMSVNVADSPGGSDAGLVMADQTTGSQWWNITARRNPAAGSREELWFGNNGADVMGVDFEGNMLVCQWRSACTATEAAMFSGTGTMTGYGTVLSMCIPGGACNINGAAKLCCAMRDF